MLIQILTSQTQSLKEQYLQKTEEWSEKEWSLAKERAHWSKSQWAKWLGVETEMFQGVEDFKRGFYNTAKSKEFHKEQVRLSSILSLKKELYIERRLKEAVSHYESSIEKLAKRIEEKQLDHSKLEVKTSHIGVNIETVLTDGSKTVRAFTILAWGEIQRPHYRYLVK
jgi:hypothetical protein